MGGRSSNLNGFGEVKIPGSGIKPNLLSSERTMDQGDGAWEEQGIYQGICSLEGCLPHFSELLVSLGLGGEMLLG